METTTPEMNIKQNNQFLFWAISSQTRDYDEHHWFTEVTSRLRCKVAMLCTCSCDSMLKLERLFGICSELISHSTENWSSFPFGSCVSHESGRLSAQMAMLVTRQSSCSCCQSPFVSSGGRYLCVLQFGKFGNRLLQSLRQAKVLSPHPQEGNFCQYRIVPCKRPWALAAQTPKIRGGPLHGGVCIGLICLCKRPPRI